MVEFKPQTTTLNLNLNTNIYKTFENCKERQDFSYPIFMDLKSYLSLSESLPPPSELNKYYQEIGSEYRFKGDYEYKGR